MNGTFVVIPAYNEARTIAAVIADVRARMPQRIIVVDDGSTDATASLVAAAGRDGVGCPVELLHHRHNQGKAFALADGMARALQSGARRIITIDADGQHSGADIPRLERAAADHPRAIFIAARLRGRERAPRLRRFANDVADFWISWACGRRIDDTQSGFRLYPAERLACVRTRPRRNQGFLFETELLIDAVRGGADVRAVSIATLYRPDGRASHYRPWRDTWHIVRLVGGKLLRRGMDPAGLVRSLRRSRMAASDWAPTLGDGD